MSTTTQPAHRCTVYGDQPPADHVCQPGICWGSYEALARLSRGEPVLLGHQDRCQFEHEAWGPHPGCVEFVTEPDTWECGAPATVVHVEQGFDPYGGGERYVAVRTFCAEHAQLARDEALTWPGDIEYVQRAI